MHSGAMQSGAMQTGAMQSGAMQSGAMQSGAMHSGAMQSGAMQSGAMQSGAMQSGAMHPPLLGVSPIASWCPRTVVVSRDGTSEFCKLANVHMSRRGSEAGSFQVGRGGGTNSNSCGALPCTVKNKEKPPAGDAAYPTHIEVEYRVKVHDAIVWKRFVQCLRLVPDAVTHERVYSVLSFPADVRATRLKQWTGSPTQDAAANVATEGVGGNAEAIRATSLQPETARTAATVHGPDKTDLRLEQKTTLLRMRIGTVQSCPLWGVVATERPLTNAEAAPYVHAVRELVEGDVDLARAVLTPPLTEEWLCKANMDLRFKRGRQGARERYLSCPGYVLGQHVAFGSVRVPSRTNSRTNCANGDTSARDSQAQGASTAPRTSPAWCTPVSVRDCTRTSFQWDTQFRVDCTVMSLNDAEATYHVEVECCGDQPVPFPRQVEDLLRQQVKACATV